MTLFCKYSHIFGESKKGIHTYRLGPFGLVDITITFLIGALFGYYFISKDLYGILSGFIIFIFIGFIFHYLFCADSVIKF